MKGDLFFIKYPFVPIELCIKCVLHNLKKKNKVDLRADI